MMKKYAIISCGELLVDMIGTTISQNLSDATAFERFQGGSPANMGANMARLGHSVALVSCVGNDNLGTFLVNEIAKTGIDTQFIAVSEQQPTTIVVVSRSTGTPDFIAYRTADRMLQPAHISNDLLANASFFHTTCFALSLEPAQSTIVDAARRAAALGCQISLDANYAPSIWRDREQAWKVISEYCSYGAFIKLSEDDAERLYGSKQSNQSIIRDLHTKGATLVCLTLGAEGSIISYENGEKEYRLYGKKIEVKDVTGAGDAFWSGFLTAYLDGHPVEICAEAGANLAALKLTTVGPLPSKVDKAVLYK
jgi:sugar/nucleoside kinase (ribokinase family)